MIGRLRGRLLEKQPPHLLLDVNGVGYEIQAPMSTFYQLPGLGEDVVLHTHLIVREDAHILCGFGSEPERRLFRSLIKVSGVGAKLALAVLSGISANDFARCIHDNDVASLTRLPGVGKKTAERLVVEMRDRLDDWQSESGLETRHPQQAVAGEHPEREAISALIALGYKPQEASRLVAKVEAKDMSSEDIIRAALKHALG